MNGSGPRELRSDGVLEMLQDGTVFLVENRCDISLPNRGNWYISTTQLPTNGDIQYKDGFKKELIGTRLGLVMFIPLDRYTTIMSAELTGLLAVA